MSDSGGAPRTVREWVVAGAVIETDDGLLLVQNLRHNGSLDWTPPGGVIEVHEGESIIDGLTREVHEETGLRVTNWSAPLYRVATSAPEEGWLMRVEVFRALDVTGRVEVGSDPDGIVVDACFVDPDRCGGHLAGGHRWVHEPLLEWLSERWESADQPDGVDRNYLYEVSGWGSPAAEVVRLL